MQAFVISFFLSALANTAVLWLLQNKVPQMLHVSDSFMSIFFVGLLIAALNMLVRPLLNIIALPLRLFASILAMIVVNGLFVQILVAIVDQIGIPNVSLTIGGGWTGWIVVAVALGLTNWITRLLIK